MRGRVDSCFKNQTCHKPVCVLFQYVSSAVDSRKLIGICTLLFVVHYGRIMV